MSSKTKSDEVLVANFTDTTLADQINKNIVGDGSMNNLAGAYDEIKNNIDKYLEKVRKQQLNEERTEDQAYTSILKSYEDIYKDQEKLWNEQIKFLNSIIELVKCPRKLDSQLIIDYKNYNDRGVNNIINTLKKIYTNEDIKQLYFTEINRKYEHELVKIIKTCINSLTGCYAKIVEYEKNYTSSIETKKDANENLENIRNAKKSVQTNLNNLKTTLIKCLYDSYNILLDSNNKEAREYVSYYLQGRDDTEKYNNVKINGIPYHLPLPFDLTNINLIIVKYLIDYIFKELINTSLNININYVDNSDNNIENNIFFTLLDYVIDLKECKEYKITINAGGLGNQSTIINMHINKLYLVRPHIIFDYCLTRFDNSEGIDIRQSVESMFSVYDQLRTELYKDLTINNNISSNIITTINANIEDEVINAHINIIIKLVNLMIFGSEYHDDKTPIRGSVIDIYVRLWEGDITGTNVVKQLSVLQNSPFTLADTSILWNRFTSKFNQVIKKTVTSLNIAKVFSPIIFVAVITLFILIEIDIIKTNSWKTFWKSSIMVVGILSAIVFFIIGLSNTSYYVITCSVLILIACVGCMFYWVYTMGKEDNNTPAETPVDPNNNGDKPPENPDDNNGEAGTPPETPTDPNGDKQPTN